MRLTNRLRVLAATAIATHQLVSDSVTERRAAARRLQRDAQPGMLAFLEKRVSDETDAVARQALLLAVANLQLASPQPEVRRKAVELLGQSDDPDVQSGSPRLPCHRRSRIARCARPQKRVLARSNTA